MQTIFNLLSFQPSDFMITTKYR